MYWNCYTPKLLTALAAIVVVASSTCLSTSAVEPSAEAPKNSAPSDASSTSNTSKAEPTGTVPTAGSSSSAPTADSSRTASTADASSAASTADSNIVSNPDSSSTASTADVAGTEGHASNVIDSKAVELSEEAASATEQSSFIKTARTNSASSRPRIGLALGGGGTRGSAHIGVLRVLEKEGIKVDCVSGTSIGAIVGGLYCAGVSIDDIEKMFLNKKLLHSYQTVPIWVRLAVVPVFVLPHLVGYHHYDGLYRGNKFAHFIEKSVPRACRSIENLKIPFCAVASSLVDGKSHGFKSGCLARAIQASSAIPVLRRPVEIDKDLYVDGGIIDNLPVSYARELGADIVIAVDVDERFQRTGSKEDLLQFTKIGSVGNRVISMILSRVDEDSVESADVLIQPKVNEISLLSESKKQAMEAIAQGEMSARAQLPAIRAAIAAFSSK